MASHPRPIAPFMLGQAYRLQLTSFTSFLHRVTGVFLAIGILALVYWLIAAAASAEAFDQAQVLAGSIVGRSLLFLWTGAFFYHLLNGIRHLAWDAGWGFELPTAYRTGWSVLAGSAVLTFVAWALGYWARGNL
ncbi:MAG TPA: succinate dehydrogenase, cytochrome b556 subunit [Dongiaceae bacterium]|nr:succinate dehydrogenase, cytochrome b556 subunit [Dongiaceae bacterium]